MPLRILSFFNDNVTWRIAKTPDGYYHREPSGMPEWQAGVPAGMSLDIIESTFQQFSSTDRSLQPTNLSFKLTYRVGHSNVECYIFSSSEGDTFSVKIPIETFKALEKGLSSDTIPHMRIARLVIQQAIQSGLPSVELLPETPLYKKVQSELSGSFPPLSRS
jgi:hypothetical protein